MEGFKEYLKELKFADLFSGIGGFRLALEPLGISTVWACEINRAAQLTYEVNFGSKPFNNIRKADLDLIPEFDVLTAGFPCQDFSGLGEQNGLEGSKGNLFFEILKFLKKFKPRFLILENVKGLTTSNNGKNLEIVIENLESHGYWVTWKLINSQEIVPQFRNRVYIVGILKEGFDWESLRYNFRFLNLPLMHKKRKLDSVLQTNEEEPFLEAFKINTAKWKSVKRSRSVLKLGVRKRIVCSDDEVCDTIISNYRNSLKNTAQFVSKFSSSEADKIYLSSEVNIEKRPRWFTSRELARLMLFPESYKLYPNDVKCAEQLGNAITPPVVTVVALSLLSFYYFNKIDTKYPADKLSELIQRFSDDVALDLIASTMNPDKVQAYLGKLNSTNQDFR